MNNATIALHQVEFEQKSFWRNPAAAFFAFLFPIIFLVVFATLFKDSRTQVGPVTVSYNDYYIPALVAFGVMGACFTNIAMSISLRRDNGILKRLRGTPLPSWAFIAGVVGSSIIVSIVLTLLTTLFRHRRVRHPHAAAHPRRSGDRRRRWPRVLRARTRDDHRHSQCRCGAGDRQRRLPADRLHLRDVLPGPATRRSSRRSPRCSRCATSSTRCSWRSTPRVSRRAVSTAPIC